MAFGLWRVGTVFEITVIGVTVFGGLTEFSY